MLRRACLILPLWLGCAAAQPQPLVGWSAELPAGTRLDDPLHWDTDVVPAVGSAAELTTLRLWPSLISDGHAARCRPTWTNSRRGPGALRLCAGDAAAEYGAVVQVGGDSPAPRTLRGFTLYLAFRLDAGPSYGGGSPPWELDGTLLSLAPGVRLQLTGRGPDGRGRRLPQLRLSGPGEAVYTPQMDGEVRLDAWTTVVYTWDGGTQQVRCWTDGREWPLAHSGAPSAPTQLAVSQPPLLGGDRRWGNVPLVLDSFALFDQALTPEQCAALPAWQAGPPGRGTAPVRPAYEVLTAANQPAGWQAPGDVTLQAAAQNTLRIGFPGLPTNEARVLRLAQPVPLDTAVTAVDFWACTPASPTECGYSLTPLFADAAGKLIPGSGLGFLESHVAAPNARAAGQWRYVYSDIPRQRGATQLIGFAIRGGYVGRPEVLRRAKSIYLKDVALERIDYSKARLYYVVGNYRDNFQNTGFNNCGAHALSEISGGSEVPYVLLDNLLDQAKQGRPARVNLSLAAYDVGDRLVYAASHDDLAAADAPDLMQRIPIRLAMPGTYRIKGKTYDAATGEYFTTDWAKLVVIKGGDPLRLDPPVDWSPLAVDPDRPFGRLEPGERREIAFEVAGDAKQPRELRYTVLPYDRWVPGWSAVRDVPLDHKLPVRASTVLKVPYETQRAVSLVVAELWQGNRRLDHEERAIGIRNELDRAPAFTNRRNIPSLDDLAGPGRNWFNTQLHLNPGDDALAALKRNLDEAKRLTPLTGVCPDINRLEPIPGVFDWDYLTPMLDLAAEKGCRIVPYLNLKWPVDWAPVEFQLDGAGCAHRGGLMWGYMIGKYLYCNGQFAPAIIRRLNQQLARHYFNHPGLGGWYFENEHIDSYNGPLNSYHPAYQRAFGAYLQGRYGTIAALNGVYGTSYAAFDAVPLPDPQRPSAFGRRVMFADLRLFQRQTAERFVLDDEFDAVRHEDPQRPIIVYNLGQESDGFLRHVADGGGMMANGGIHSNFHVDFEYERANAIPGLRYRMEPHDMYNYDPITHGFDEMIFGMLATGGRGLMFHEFLRGFGTVRYDELMKPGQRTGLDKVVAHQPMLQELRDAEKRHDEVGLLQLHSPQDTFRGPFEWGIWCMHCGLYALQHWCPKTAAAQGRPEYLDGCKLVFAGGSVVDSAQLAWLKRFLAAGGRLVMQASTGQWTLERPDEVRTHALLDALGVDFFAAGQKLPEIQWSHDVYAVGAGQVLVMRRPLWNDQWAAVVPAITHWAGLSRRLCDSDDRYMQMHVLQRGTTWYLATTHRGKQQSGYDGPDHWSGQVRFLQALAPGSYRVVEMMSGREVGTFTPAQLAGGFDAGAYADLELKVFRIAPAR